MSKKLNMIIWSLSVVGIVILQGFVGKSQNAQYCTDVSIHIAVDNDEVFITDQMVQSELQRIYGNLKLQPMSQLQIGKIEEHILNIPEVESVQAYKTVDAKLVVNIVPRKPIVRLINKGGKSSFYIDRRGYLMPLSTHKSARVLVVSGEIKEMWTDLSMQEIELNDSLRDAGLLDDVFRISEKINEDLFWEAQIQQIYVNKDSEFELIPRIGAHRILFGKAEEIDEKLEKLRIFYKQGLGLKDWNQYDTLNLKFKDQIVCSKR